MTFNDAITVFYACDDRYMPYLSVSLLSLAKNSNKDRKYNVVILHSGLDGRNIKSIKGLETENISVSFANLSDSLRRIASRLSLRDYYSLSIYYRIFIPEMFKSTDKAVYLDADTVVLGDIAELFETKLDGALVAAVPDKVVASEEIFRNYATDGVGVPFEKYFNSGVLVMDLEKMRDFGLQAVFTELLEEYGFETICPDQDYLNVICRDRVCYLGTEWNRMSVDRSPCGELKLIHYNMFFKPWLYPNVQYEEYFWEYAKHSPFFEEILDARRRFGEESVKSDEEAGKALRKAAQAIIDSEKNFKNSLEGVFA